MERNHFNLGEKKALIWKGQRWTLSNKTHAKFLPDQIEIVDIVSVTEAKQKITKCKIREVRSHKFTTTTYGRTSRLFEQVDIDKLTQFMLAGDILTYYEQV